MCQKLRKDYVHIKTETPPLPGSIRGLELKCVSVLKAPAVARQWLLDYKMITGNQRRKRRGIDGERSDNHGVATQ